MPAHLLECRFFRGRFSTPVGTLDPQSEIAATGFASGARETRARFDKRNKGVEKEKQADPERALSLDWIGLINQRAVLIRE